MYGIDISHHQGNIDWSKLTQDFYILKCTQGTKYTDDKFEAYYNEAIKKDVPVGAYIYNKVLTIDDAKAEAMHAVEVLKNKKLSAGVWLDLEDRSMRVLPKSTLNAIIKTEAEILRNAGFNVGIYCNVDWYKNVLDSKTLCEDFVFWLARYTSDLKQNPLLKQQNTVMWQYSSKGKVTGINGNVDLDFSSYDISNVMLLYGGAK